MKNIQVSASILCADFKKLGDEIKKCQDAGVDMIHVDVMDGHFVPNISIGQIIVETVRPITKLPIDSHLMITNPSMYVEDFCRVGSDIVSIHAECYGPLRSHCRGEGQFPKEVESIDSNKILVDIEKIHAAGKKAFVVLNPGTPVCIQSILPKIDGVLIMSVNPGFAKQKFMPQVVSKIVELRKIFNGDIAVDGGVNAQTAPEAVAAGANILATASYFFGAPDPKDAVKFLKSLKS